MQGDDKEGISPLKGESAGDEPGIGEQGGSRSVGRVVFKVIAGIIVAFILIVALVFGFCLFALAG